MDTQDIFVCEELLKVVNNMYFKELQGKELVSKMIVFQNFGKMVNKYKNPAPLTPDKESKASVKGNK